MLSITGAMTIDLIVIFWSSALTYFTGLWFCDHVVSGETKTSAKRTIEVHAIDEILILRLSRFMCWDVKFKLLLLSRQGLYVFFPITSVANLHKIMGCRFVLLSSMTPHLFANF